MKLGLGIAAAVVLTVGHASSLYAKTGTIEGTVLFEGTAPTPKKIVPTTDSAICELQGLVDESLLVDAKSKGIRSVAVWVVGSKGGKSKKAPLLDNYRCRYEPHVLIAHKNQKIDIRNRDKFLHTSQARQKGKSLFNVALPIRNQTVKKKFKKPGVYSVHCDVHDWMKAWVVVLEGEKGTTTDVNGAFKIEGVPAGDHEIELWHETLGAKRVKVSVKAGETTKTSVTYKGK